MYVGSNNKKLSILKADCLKLKISLKIMLNLNQSRSLKRNPKIRIAIVKIKISNNIMGSKQSTVENGCIQELSKINEEELDISRIDNV